MKQSKLPSSVDLLNWQLLPARLAWLPSAQPAVDDLRLVRKRIDVAAAFKTKELPR